MGRIIVHADLNAFFVRCEELRDPSLEGKAVLIGQKGRSGIVSTASYEARKRGCHSGQPMFQALQNCPEAIVIPPDFDRYQVMSNSFFAYLGRFTSILERASIDEGYMDLTVPLSKSDDPIGYLKDLQNGLFAETGLRCSLGVAPTKWLAKMASDLKKPMGLTLLRRKDIETVLYPLPIESFWGIGKKTSPRLRFLGVNTIGDLASALSKKDPMVLGELGKFAYTAENWIRGYGSDQVDPTPWDPKSIGASETLMHDSSTLEEVAPVIKRLASEVSKRALSERKTGKGITLQVKDVTFHLHSKAIPLEESTASSDVIESRCLKCYEEFFQGKLIRLVGITLDKLVDPVRESVQMSLWNYEEYEQKDATKLLIADLNRKLDKPLLMRGREAKKHGSH